MWVVTGLLLPPPPPELRWLPLLWVTTGLGPEPDDGLDVPLAPVETGAELDEEPEPLDDAPVVALP